MPRRDRAGRDLVTMRRRRHRRLDKARPRAASPAARRRRRRAGRARGVLRRRGWVDDARSYDRAAARAGRRGSRARRSSSRSTRPPSSRRATSAEVDAYGNIVVPRRGPTRRHAAPSPERASTRSPSRCCATPSYAIVDEMGMMLERVAHSLVVSEGRDFSTAICDADGRLVAEGKEDLPAHVGTLPHTVKAVIEWIGKDRLHEGDIIIMNDAFLGGTHCQDVRTIMPVYRHGALVAFTQNSAHWSDSAGPSPARSTRRRSRATARRCTSRPSTSSARASSTTRCCASSCATPGCRTSTRVTASRRSPRVGPARRGCRR